MDILDPVNLYNYVRDRKMFDVKNVECTCECESYCKTNKKIYTFPDDFILKSLSLTFNVKYVDKEFFKIKETRRK